MHAEMGILLLKLQMNSYQFSMSFFIKTLIFVLQDKFQELVFVAQINGTDWAFVYFFSYILYFLPEGISLNRNRQEEKLQFCFIEVSVHQGCISST